MLVLTVLIGLGGYWLADTQRSVTVPVTITHVAGCEVTGRLCYAEFTTHYTTRPEEVKYYSMPARDHAKLVVGHTGMYYKTKYETSSGPVRALILVTWLIMFCLGVWWVSEVYDVIELLINAHKVRRNEAYLTVQRGKHRRGGGDSTFGETKRTNSSSSNDSFLGGMFFGSSSSDSGSSGSSGSSDDGGGGSD